MALNINGAILSGVNDAIQITTNSVVGLKFNTNGMTIEGKKPYFIAQGNSNTWVQYSAATWHTINPANVIVNNGGHFNTSNGRFTAPVKGTYYFMAQTYNQHYPTPTRTNYLHPMFWINGSSTVRQGSVTTPYRLWGRTNATSTYSFDANVDHIYDLEVGDYVEYKIYANNANLRHYTTRDIFSGFLIN